MALSTTIGRWVERLVSGPDHVVHEGRVLPAPRLRFGGRYFRDDADFLRTAIAEAERVGRELGVGPESRLVEIGCGPGRLPIGLIEVFGALRSYVGFDVNARAVDWCSRHIAAAHPSFRFVHVKTANPRYNPGGQRQPNRLDVPDGEADAIYLYSVFSHLLTDEVTQYLAEFRRVLAPEGKVFLTAFSEEGVPPVEENPPDYRGGGWKGPLHCVRYDRAFLEGLFEEHGLRVERFAHGGETDGQSAYVLARGDGTDRAT